VAPVAYHERRLDAFLISHEVYRGFFAEAHTHAEWQIQVPLRGRIHVTIGDERHLAGPESMILMPPGVGHAALYLDGELELFNVMAPATWGAPTDQARVVPAPFVWALAKQLASELAQPAPGSDRMLATGVEQLGIALARAYHEASSPGAVPDAGVLRVVEVMLRDYWRDLTVAELAGQVGITPRHFDRRFRAAIGVTPKQFLIDVRLRVARDLLASTDRTVTEIALDVGFQQASHFIRTFHRAVGLPPAAYRRQLRAAPPH
jgi:AraC-like DNA-binding protein